MGDMGTDRGLPDMKMYGSTAPATAAQVIAAGQLIKATDASLARYQNVQAAFAAGYTYVLKTNGEEHLLYNGAQPRLRRPQPAAPVLAGLRDQRAASRADPARRHVHRERERQRPAGRRRADPLALAPDGVRGGKPTIAGFGVQLRGTCNPATWQDRYTAQMLHVWVVPYPGGPFSDDLSRAATNAAVRAVLAR